MKFLCPGCKAKYQISDQKVAGKTLKMNCRQCGEEIVIRGDGPAPGGPAPRPMAPPAPPGQAGPAGAPPPPPPPPAAAGGALGAGFRSQLNSQAPVAPTAAPDEWHVAINDIPVGPMRREEVGRKIAAGAVTGESLAWREGLDDWLPVRNIPELAVMCRDAVAYAPPTPPPPAELQPAMRAPQVAPVGARPAPPPPEPPQPAFATSAPGNFAAPSPQAPMENTGVSVVQGMPSDPSRNQPNLAAMIFMALAAGAFLIMLGGLMFKMMAAPTESARAPAPAPAPVQAPAPAPAAHGDEAEDDGEAHVIDLDMEEISGQSRTARAKPRAKSAKPAPAKKPTNSGGKQLTAAEKARLARMGGNFGSTPGSLGRTASSSGGGPKPGSGGLTSSQLSKVVLKQRKNLQRCYETALRQSPSDDAVRLDVEITVSPSGNVTKTKVTGNGLNGMDRCIQRSVKMWRFPKAGDSSKVKFPLLFQPGG